MKRLVIVITLSIVACLFVNHGALAQAYQHAATGIVFPEQLATLEKGRVTDYEKTHPGLGVAVGYNGPGITVTIYVYTMGMTSVPDDLQAATIRNHFKQVTGDIVRAEKRGYYSNVRKISVGEVSWGNASTATRSLHASFSYIQNGKDRFSHLYLMGFKNHFLKVRFTYDATEQAIVVKLQKKFLGDLGRIIK